MYFLEGLPFDGEGMLGLNFGLVYKDIVHVFHSPVEFAAARKIGFVELNGSESGDIPDVMHVVPIDLRVIIFCVFTHDGRILNSEQIRQMGWKWLLDR